MRLLKTRRRSAWWARAAPGVESFADVVDPEIEALPAESRARLAAIWQTRGGLELRVASGFSTLSVELFEHGASQVVYEIVSRAIRDEVHHAQISVEIAAKYRGDAPIWPEPEPTHVPPFSPTKGAMHATLYVIAQSCINETVACSVLEAALAEVKSPLVRAGLHAILSDEVDHARAGWAHLASPYVTREMKRALPVWLHRLHVAKFRELFDEHEAPPEGDRAMSTEDFARQGILSRARLTEIAHASLVNVIFPGFRRAGIDPSQAEEWARGAFKDVAARVGRAG